jgi:DNA polymerase-3 subunit delta
MSSGALRLVLGDEELLASRAVAAVVAASRAADPETVVETFSAAEMTIGDLLGAVSPALFGGRRVVVIRDGQDAGKDLAAAILSYVAAPEPDITVVVTHLGGAKGKAFADGLRAAGATETAVAKLKPWDLPAFVKDEIRRLGGRCGDGAAEALISAVGTSLRELAMACQQLVADTDGRVDTATVARYYRGRAEVSGYTISDAVMCGDLPGALEALRWAQITGVDPVVIAAALSDGVRTMSRVASARGNARQLAATLGLPWKKVERFQQASRAWSPEALGTAMRIVGVCNVDARGGVEDRDYAMERAVFDLVALRGSARS